MTNASAMLDALAEPTRRAIVERLAHGPAAVRDLARDMPITRSGVFPHWKVLKAVGLVNARAVGTRRVYTVDPDALALIREYFDAFWNRSLAAFQAAAELQQEDE